MKFTDNGTITLTIEIEKPDVDDKDVEGQSVQPDSVLRFTVDDTGIGMAADQQEILFQSFSQADSSTTRKYGGTGLGLAISKHLTELMGGKIWLESEQGVGSTFQFTVVLEKHKESCSEDWVIPKGQVPVRALIIDDNDALKSFLKDFAALEGPKILVHGGGKLATKLASQMNVEVQMVDGRRITNTETLDLITMVYAGKINKNIVAALQQYSCNAIGFSGADGNTIISEKRPVIKIDYGFVGDVVKVNTSVLESLLNQRITPVFCAITHDNNGQLLNTNADTIASELAIGFADKFNTELYYCFEKNGVLQDIKDDDSVIENINPQTYQELIASKVISDGMLPKLDNCFYAINQQVAKVCIGTFEMLFNKELKYTTIQK